MQVGEKSRVFGLSLSLTLFCLSAVVLKIVYIPEETIGIAQNMLMHVFNFKQVEFALCLYILRKLQYGNGK